LTHVNAARAPERPADQHAAAPAAPGVVAFRPRSDTFPPPARPAPNGHQPASGFHADRDEPAALLIEGDLARAARALRGPAVSTLHRPAANGSDRAETQPARPDQPSDPGSASADAAAWAASELPGQATSGG